MPGDRSRTIEDQRELFGLLDSAGVPWSLNGVGAMRFWGVPKVVTVRESMRRTILSRGLRLQNTNINRFRALIL